MTSISGNGIDSLKKILFIREYLDYDDLLKGGYERNGIASPLDNKGKGQVKEEKWDEAIDTYLTSLSHSDKQAFINLFNLKGSDGQPLAPDKLRAYHISAQILTDKKSSKDLVEAIKKVLSSSITNKNEIIAILFIREYLDYDDLLKGGYERNGIASPLDNKGKGQVKEEKWDEAIDTYLTSLSHSDKQAFINLFNLKGSDGQPLAPDKLRAYHISAQILTDKKSSKDLVAAICKLDPNESFCPTLNALKPVEVTAGGPEVEITLTGANLPIDGTISFGDKINVTVISRSATEIKVTVEAENDAAVGSRPVLITSQDGFISVSLDNVINVTSAAPADMKIFPTEIHPGETVNFVVTGNNFRDGMVGRVIVSPDVLWFKLPNPNYSEQGSTSGTYKKMTWKNPVIFPDYATPGEYTITLCSSDPGPNQPCASEDVIKTFTVTILAKGERVEPEWSKPIGWKASVETGGYTVTGNSLPNQVRAYTEKLGEPFYYRLHLGVNPHLFGKENAFFHRNWMDLLLRAYGSFMSDVRSGDDTLLGSFGLGLNYVPYNGEKLGLNYWAPEVYFNYIFKNNDYQHPNRMLPSGRSHLLTGGLAFNGNIYPWGLKIRPYFETSWQNMEYSPETMGFNFHPGWFTNLTFGADFIYDIFALNTSFTFGKHPTPEHISNQLNSHSFEPNYRLNVNLTHRMNYLPKPWENSSLFVVYERESRGSWPTINRVSWGFENSIPKVGTLTLTLHHSNRGNFYYPLSIPVGGELRWTLPWANNSISFGVRMDDLKTDTHSFGFGGYMNLNLYRFFIYTSGEQTYVKTNP